MSVDVFCLVSVLCLARFLTQALAKQKMLNKFSLALSDKNLPKDLNNMVFFK
jgi:hypothetical protein